MRNACSSWLFSIGIAMMTYSVVLSGRCSYAHARESIKRTLRRMAFVQSLADDETALLRAVFQAKLRGEQI